MLTDEDPAMASKAEALLRQQYLVPQKSVRKLRELSRLRGVSAGELARRAIEAYLSGDAPQNPEDERAALSLLEEIHAKVAATLSRIEHLAETNRTREQALNDGSFRARIKAQITEALQGRSDEVAAIREILGLVEQA